MAKSSSDDESSSASSSSSQEPPQKKIRASGPSAAPPMEVTAIKEEKKAIPKIIILLDQANLETVKTRRGSYELLNCDDHRDLCKKFKKDPKFYRPDICHQELLALVDSPLNKAGLLQFYIRTQKNVLIELNPSIRLPRTFKRFSGLMVQLLHKMKVKAANTSVSLMKVVKNPFSSHLPPGTKVYGMSCKGTLHSPSAVANMLVQDNYADDTPPVCFIFGAMSEGHVTQEDHPCIEKMICLSEYPLSGAAAISRLLGAVEHHWGII